MDRIVVTGIGVISAIGNNVAENRHALINRNCGMGKLEMFPSHFSGILPVGEIKISNESLQKKLQVHEPGVTRTSLLALHALQEALQESRLTPAEIAAYDTALISANTVGGMCLTDEMYHDSKKETGSSEYISSYDYGSINRFLQSRFHFSGPINTINTACSSSANAIMYGARLIKSGRVKRAIVGGTDSLAKFTINGFNSLRILSNEICTPFDEGRKGLNLGEGAAFLVLEKESEASSKKIYAALSGYANANDAFHASSLSDDAAGPYKVMKEALEVAGLSPADIGFINAHGTGTENNDLVESIAMKKLFSEIPPFASTKANTGHTLGAAAAIEAVYAILNLSEQEIYPAINFNVPITATGLIPADSYRKAELEHVMSNSFGFGGNCSSLIFSRA
ncbi:MAG: beta-ketoacyl-[acyl-carrier-protein] synthase family protein [Bacteroidetes bacterium]|nr:beta-ketoacyl-[acyl-carrier-protein] synthase family protein [Bacteroidota bacterium]